MLPAVCISCFITEFSPFQRKIRLPRPNRRHSWLTTDLSSSTHDTKALIHNDTTFADLGIESRLLSSIQSQRDWLRPTTIQKLAIPVLLQQSSRTTPNNDVDPIPKLSLMEEKERSATAAVWCEAPTGGGKTACYVVPLVQNILALKKQQAVPGKVLSLILCPTRELVTQIGAVVNDIVSNVPSVPGSNQRRPWNIVQLLGGVPKEPQISSIARCILNGATIDVLIATPGRLVDILQQYDNNEEGATEASLERRVLEAMDASPNKRYGKKKGRMTTRDRSLSLDQIQKLKLDDPMQDDRRASIPNILKQVQYLILDEADRLLSRTFEEDMEQVLRLLTKSPPAIPYTWLFSATFPKHVEPRVDYVLKRIGQNDAAAPSCIRISCVNSDRSLQDNENDISGRLSRKLEHVEVPQEPTIQQVDAASTIALRAIRMEKRNRSQVLRLLLEQQRWDQVLVFVATRYAAEHVSRKLRRYNIVSAELHGKLEPEARTRRLQDLVRGKIRVLIATDLASRGLDIVGLPVVINYDLPRSPADFVHRIGRTGRAGRSGTAITFVTPDSESHLDLIEKRYLSAEQRLVRETIPGFEPNEELWRMEADSSRATVPGTEASNLGLAHDRMFGGIKGRRKSKKDKLRERQSAADMNRPMQ
jgi:superfamily II DNA/RNA helicase